MKLQEIAERLGGTVEGDGSLEITGINGMELAEPGQITFLADKKFKDQLEGLQSFGCDCIQSLWRWTRRKLIHPAPALAFAKLLAELHPVPRPEPGIDEKASIAEGVQFGENVSIGPFVALGKGCGHRRQYGFASWRGGS